MKPIPLNNPWRQRRSTVFTGVLLAVVSVLMAEPSTWVGVAITLATVPFILLAFFEVRVRWHRRFGGSKFMSIVFFFAILLAALAILHLAKQLQPYIGMHFA
ncbi:MULTISPECIES: hypothetical protein [unclassified Pseudomonas]|uniref:hypothetical protein n=1 Tax=unclassified Pseudomonas TaxID=196821 RepID=UPI00244BE8F9|nr:MULTISPECIES: hypothetical protein [unclassified Pseudomonas]MDH0892983.1 hypothetical protein [Pseudomonas sp. GD03875]MDH1067472.1 hypothetical protein [Pseudomonas sp. GD03985]